MKIFSLLCLSIVAGSAKAAFQRVGTFFICSQISPTCNTNITTTAEIVAATDDGNTLLYTDGTYGKIGFVNITNPANPTAAGTIDFTGSEPTSVAIRGGLALAAINTSPSLTNPTGYLAVINITSRTIIRNITLPGQPDCVSWVSDLVAIAIENERNESFAIPQSPAGSVVLINSANPDPALWTLNDVNVSGLPNVLYAPDPEPEYVAINGLGVVAVTLQENNAVVLIAPNGTVLASFDAGSVNLTQVDTSESGGLNVNQNQNITKRREPDGIAWIDNTYFVTANEGDFPDGGSRGFTIFDSTTGSVVYDSGKELEWILARIGNYNEDRSANRGNEPESVLVATFGGKKLLFVLSERSSIIFVYDVTNPTAPVYVQVMAASTIAPEGIVAIPSRNLLAVANENDNRASKFRSSISIYQNTAAPPDYPSLQSVPRVNGTQGPFIPFSALSGFAASPSFGAPLSANPTILYTVEDSVFRINRILTIEVTGAGAPYRVTSEMTIKDTGGVLRAALAPFPNVNVATRINADNTTNIDPEGIAISRIAGTAWVASEGAGNLTFITLPNLLLQVSLVNGTILRAVTLPPAVNAIHTSNGYEGVAEYGDYVVLLFQREWVGETKPRLGIYNYVLDTWKFVFYPLDNYTSQFATGGWVGLSDLAPVGNGKFLVIERDNQGGPDASIKKLYEIDLGSNLGALAENSTVTKVLKLDMIPQLKKTWGFIPEKVEGCAIDAYGNVWVNNDNDGMVNNAGEQQLINMGQLYFPKVSSAPSAAPSRSPVKAPVKAPVVAPVPAPVVAPVATPVAPVPTPVAPVPTPVAPVPTKAPVKAPAPVAPVPVPVAPTLVPTVAPAPTPCGLFGLGIYCPRTQCGILGRVFGLCDEE